MSENKSIYVSDLDGTILKNDGTISEFSKSGLIKLIEAGVNVTVASARSVDSINYALHGIPFALPVISINGAFISDLNSGKHLIVNEIEKNTLENIYRYIMSYNCMPFMSSYDGEENHLYYQSLPNDGMEWHFLDRKRCGDKRLRHISDLRAAFNEQVVSFTVINTRRQLVNLAKKMQQDFSERLEMFFFENPYSPPWYWLTIHDRKACKAQAARELLDYTGFDVKDLVVFGDNLNDVNMFKMAKRAVAVSNSSDQIRKLATEIIGSNEQDSVIKYIMERENII